ncbi:sciellin isoform X2 [Scyliorhinus torazame]|uniref:sciellin isoform X2 n=1 Tax=Scyliorhinus torazame TaxID=75743 RepID=UPI003B5A635E
MALFRRFADSFTDKKNTQADEDRDQVIQETKKRSRLMNDNVWIKSKPEETQQVPADVNYGKSVLNPVQSDEKLNSDPSKTSNPRSTTKADTFDGRKRTWVINGGRSKAVFSRFRSEEFLDRDTGSTSDLSKTQRASTLDRPTSSEPAHGHHEKVVLSRYRSEEILNRTTGSTDISSPTSKYSSLDRKSRTNSYKGEDVPTMTIITSEPKSESPTSKGLQSRPSPDGQVTTQEKSPTKPILKWGSQKDESPESRYEPKTSTLERNRPKTSTKTESQSLIDLTPPTERKSKGSDFLSNFVSKSLIDLSLTPEKSNAKSPVTTPTTPVRTSSLIELSPSIPAKSKRNNTEWDKTSPYTSTSSKSTFNPNNSSEDWDELNSSTTTSTKSSFNSRNPSNIEDRDNTNSYTTTSTKTYDPKSRSSRKSGDWENASPTTTTITKTSPDSILKSTRSSTEYARPKDEPSANKSPTSYNKSSKNFSSNSLNDQNPDTEPEPYSFRSSYKENSPPDKKIAQVDETPSYRSPSYTLQKDRNSSSSLSDGKSPAKVIALTTAITSAEKRSADKNQCSHCYKPIINGPKMILAELNINCHAACLKCQICNASLESLSAGDSFWVHHRTVHCEPCYDNIKVQRSY